MSPFSKGRMHGAGSLRLGGDYLSMKRFYPSTKALIQAIPFILPKIVFPVKRKERTRPITTKAMRISVMSENAINRSRGKLPSAWQRSTEDDTSPKPRVKQMPGPVHIQHQGIYVCLMMSPRSVELIFNSTCQQDSIQGLVLLFFKCLLVVVSSWVVLL